ncbi:Uncharacterised protein [Weissella viridescens]|uniref:Uncharacterized protein n=1 Tax=Weissella viridescens TaxID=1629 RepID=A0A380P0T0_WEIVI|nr:Uncharacterised protein [Weissella viridescens]
MNDFAYLGPEMLPFARDNFAHFFVPEAYQLVSSPVWFDERQDFQLIAWAYNVWHIKSDMVMKRCMELGPRQANY